MPNTNTSPLVSVLMPAYNHAPYVRAAVESVLGQTYGNLELIAIDDASSDATWGVLQSFEDERLHLSRHDTNQGAHATLNEAMGLARGEFIAIINSDDVFAANRIDRLLAEAVASGERDVFAFTDVDFIGPAGEPANEHSRAIAYRDLRAACDALTRDAWFLAGNPAITTSNFFFSRALANEVGDFAPLRYTHDWDWALRAQKRTSPIWIREGLLGYRVHAANTLSEDDVWRHIHENSHVQARALSTLPIESGAEFAAFQTCLALLKNESFHPLPLLFYLLHRLAGVPNSRMEELTSGQGGTWLMRKLAETSACPEGIFHSVRQLAEREQTIASQAALLQERWSAIHDMNGVIIERDEAIEAQGQLLVDRWNAIEQMNGMIEERDRCIAAQDAMIQERWHTMQEMSRVIVERQEEIMDLRSDRLVKLALCVRKAMRWLRSDRGL
ncbi:MAG: glycosyltransferase [Thiobacillus sp.]|nr:glycosyltransferase [Thiobacillus sp.]MDP2057571.1 glycosyltransferase [Thiobacillus sp.]